MLENRHATSRGSYSRSAIDIGKTDIFAFPYYLHRGQRTKAVLRGLRYKRQFPNELHGELIIILHGMSRALGKSPSMLFTVDYFAYNVAESKTYIKKCNGTSNDHVNPRRSPSNTRRNIPNTSLVLVPLPST